MRLDLAWNNLVAYSLQVGLLVGLAAFVPSLLRMRSPRARLAYWQLLLVACLLLPILRPWKQQVAVSGVQISTGVVTAAPPARTFPAIPVTEVALTVLAAGFLIRIAWLCAGLWRLRHYRRRSVPLYPKSTWEVEARLRISHSVASPVTFGFRRPVVLLPANFPQLAESMQEAVLCHEILHVRRGDWLFTVAEELVRAVFWFHPAIWWLLGEIQLAREQAVDRAAIELIKSRDEYVDALLAIAGARPRLDLAPAPLFLRKRHLKQRVVSLFTEHGASRPRLAAALALSLLLVALECWLVTGAFPLVAAPQYQEIRATLPKPPIAPMPLLSPAPKPAAARAPRLALRKVEPKPLPPPPQAPSDSAGIAEPSRIRIGGNVQQTKLIYQPRPFYPPIAKQARIQGVVHLEAVIGKDGSIQDLKVISGHPLLIQNALDAVRQWVYAPTLLNGHPVEVLTRIDVNFTLSE